MKERSTLLAWIYRLKLFAIGVTLALSGLITSIVADGFASASKSHLLVAVLQALSDVLLVTGAIGIAVDFFTGRDKDAADTERVRSVLREMTPEFRDAVIDGFAVTPDNMRGVATDETLDKLATNALALRLGDKQFAREIYADLRDQAIKASERWYDLDVSIRLSSSDALKTSSSPRFDVLVKWEYTTTPSHPTQKFACVADRDEFRDLIAERPSTIPWLMPPRPGFVANAPESFELLEYRVDGDLRPIRRTTRKTGQTYTASIGEDVVRAGKPVRISYLYRTIADKSLHRMFFELTQPTRGLKLEMDYTDTDIARMSVTDLVSTNEHTRVSQLPEELEARVLSVDLPGWLLPRAGFAFVWTLRSELPDASSPAATSDEASLHDAA